MNLADGVVELRLGFDGTSRCLLLNTEDAAAAFVGVDLLCKRGHEHLPKRRIPESLLPFSMAFSFENREENNKALSWLTRTAQLGACL